MQDMLLVAAIVGCVCFVAGGLTTAWALLVISLANRPADQRQQVRQ